MRESSWGRAAEVVIVRVLKETVGIPAKERIKAVDDAYPFGLREYHPYKQWLKVRRELLSREGLIRRVSPEPGVGHSHEASPLFDPTVGPPKPIEQ